MTATLSPAPTSHYPSFDTMPIAGQWRSGGSKLSNTVVDPYRGDTLAVIGEADLADVDEAYNAAQAAQDHWASTTPGERAGVMQRAAAILVARRSEVVDWLVREGGSTLVKAQIEWDIVRHALTQPPACPTTPDDPPGRLLSPPGARTHGYLGGSPAGTRPPPGSQGRAESRKSPRG